MPNVKRSKPFIVPIFIPHAGCPHRCSFCNQHATTGKNGVSSLEDIRLAIDRFLAYRRDDRHPTEISFYGGNFLGLPAEQIQLLLATAAMYVRKGRVDGIRFSTRPDTIDTPRLDLIADFPVSTIEVGVQSLNDEVLRRNHRGHTAEEACQAISMLKARSYRTGAQVMVGLPDDTDASALSTARRLTGLAPDFVRIYPTLVLKGSPLARWYGQGRYTPMSLEAAVLLVADLFRIFALHDIPVVRMGLQPTDELTPDADLVDGPFHPAFGELVKSALWQDAISRHLQHEDLQGKDVLLEVSPRCLSQIKGPHDEHIITLMNRHRLRSIEVRASEAVAVDVVFVNEKTCRRW